MVPTSTGCSRGAEACRFGHVTRAARCLLACERWQETPRSWSSMSAAAGVRARSRRAGRSSERVFELAAREEPAWLVARREPAQHALGTLYSLAKLSGKAYRARAGCLGRDGALNSTMTTSSRSGRRQRACAARRSTAGCSQPFQQCLLPRFSRCNRLRGPAPAASLRQRCLRLGRFFRFFHIQLHNMRQNFQTGSEKYNNHT